MKSTLSCRTAIALAVVALMGSSAALADPVPVRVTNTSANPVPVSGAVTVSAPAPLPVTGAVTVSAPSALPVTGAVTVSAPAPLPVTGSVAVTTSAPLPVTVNGSVAVTSATPLSVTAATPLPVTGTFSIPSAVTVSNAAATPLYTQSASDAARVTAQIHLVDAGVAANVSVAEALSTQYVVPAGKRLVVQQVAGYVAWPQAVVAAGVRIYTNSSPNPNYFGGGGVFGINGTPLSLVTPGSAVVDATFTEWVQAQGPVVVDGGTTLWVGTLASAPNLIISRQPPTDLTLYGYLLDCAQVTCAPIVTH